MLSGITLFSTYRLNFVYLFTNMGKYKLFLEEPTAMYTFLIADEYIFELSIAQRTVTSQDTNQLIFISIQLNVNESVGDGCLVCC